MAGYCNNKYGRCPYLPLGDVPIYLLFTSWKETADIFKTSWESVYRAVQYVVEYGLSRRKLDNVAEIGVDEIQVFKGHKYLTMVYQLDAGSRKLIWCGMERKAKTLLSFFFMNLGKSAMLSSSMFVATCGNLISKKNETKRNTVGTYQLKRLTTKKKKIYRCLK